MLGSRALPSVEEVDDEEQKATTSVVPLKLSFFFVRKRFPHT